MVDHLVDTLTLLGIIGTAIIALWRTFKTTNKFLEEQEKVKTALNVIKKEVTPNSGSSIKDVVNSLKITTDRIEIRQKKIDQRSKASLHYTSAALFEIDSSGKIVWGNESFQVFTGNKKLEGYDWFSMIDDELREQFIQEITSCIKMNRKIDVETRCCQGGKIHFLGYPYMVSDSTHEGFLVHIFKGE